MALRLRTAVRTFTVRVLTYVLRLLGGLPPVASETSTRTVTPLAESAADPAGEEFVRGEVTRAMAYAFGSKERERRVREDDHSVPHGVFGLQGEVNAESRRVIDGPSSLTAPRF